MPRIVLTITQKELLKTKIGDDDLAKAIIDMVDAGVSTNGINNTTPFYVAKTDYYETTNRITTWFLTVPNIQAFWEVTMGLAPKHINALRDEAILVTLIQSLKASRARWHYQVWLRSVSNKHVTSFSMI